MITIEEKARLIQELTEFVGKMDDQVEEDSWGDAENIPDLFMLFKELTALKTEVKQESRHVKTALDSFREVFQVLQKAHDLLVEELSQRKQNESQENEKLQLAALKPLLFDLIDFQDRLARSENHYKAHKPSWIERLFKRNQSVLTSLGEGVAMTGRRLELLLEQYEVTPIVTLGKMFDSQCMQAVELESVNGIEVGIVLAEIRRGFYWKNEILRIAEVKVNK